MERMRRETLRRERRETWLLTAGGAGCFATLIADLVIRRRIASSRN